MLPPCGEPPLDSLAAVSTTHADGYFHHVCPEPHSCPECPTSPQPNYFAVCDAGHCRAADLRVDAASACDADTDCYLQFGATCCGACDGTVSDLVAISSKGGFHDAMCGTGTPCPGCAPAFPPGAKAVCAKGHCAVAP